MSLLLLLSCPLLLPLLSPSAAFYMGQKPTDARMVSPADRSLVPFIRSRVAFMTAQGG